MTYLEITNRINDLANELKALESIRERVMIETFANTSEEWPDVDLKQILEEIQKRRVRLLARFCNARSFKVISNAIDEIGIADAAVKNLEAHLGMNGGKQ